MIGVLEQLEYMNQRLASLHSDNLGLRKLLDTVKNERDHLYEKLSLSVPSLDTISKDMSSLDHDNNDFAAQYMLEIDELKVELAKKSEDIRSLTAQLQSIEAGRGKRLATDSSKDHLIDGAEYTITGYNWHFPCARYILTCFITSLDRQENFRGRRDAESICMTRPHEAMRLKWTAALAVTRRQMGRGRALSWAICDLGWQLCRPS
jgi:hypothetical protein